MLDMTKLEAAGGRRASFEHWAPLLVRAGDDEARVGGAGHELDPLLHAGPTSVVSGVHADGIGGGGGGGARVARRLTLDVDTFAWEALEEQSARQGVSIEELARFSILYYLADSDSGRIARRFPPQSAAAGDGQFLISARQETDNEWL
jgi:hypothetical protein